jgi:lysophospholipase L1-like esterase
VPNKLSRNKFRVSLCILCLILLLSQTIYYERTEANQKEPLTYLAFGDSLTAGLGSSETNYLRLHAFVPKLTAHLRNEYDVHVENHGIPGITSEQLLLYLTEGPGVEGKIKDADLITVTIGGNDLLQLLRSENLTKDKIKVTIQQFGQQFEDMISEIRNSNQNVPIHVMGLYTPYDQDHSLHLTGQLAISSYNQELLDRISSYEHVHLVSVYASFLNKESQLTHIDQNDIHPNDNGYEVIYNAFKESLSN